MSEPFVVVHGNSPKPDMGQGERMDAKKASVPREPRGEYDGKDAKLDYISDTEPGSGVVFPPSGTGEAGDCDFRTSKWYGDGQEARR